jgi:hypothetical protein
MLSQYKYSIKDINLVLDYQISI